jgi:23S rRNA pseudouridine2605 synthase
MEQLIIEGRISVNNVPAHIGQRIQYGDEVEVNGRAISRACLPANAGHCVPQACRRRWLTHDDPQKRPTVV